MSTTSEATIEIGGADSKNNDLNSSAVASTDLLSDDSFWAGRSVEAEDVPRSPSSKFLPYFEVTWLLVILGIICVGGISALIGYYNYYKSDQSLDMTRKINELASSVTALEERVATISDDQARQEVAQRRAVEASKIGFQRTFGQLSDRLDKLSYRLDDVRNEAKERDAGMALRLQGLEANELTPAATPATPQPTASTSPTDSAAPRTSPSDPVAAVNSPSAPVDSAKKDAKRKKHKKLPEHA